MGSHKKGRDTAPGIKVVRVGYLSSDGETQIRAHLWTPESNQTSPKAIIQISHGMWEHAGFYRELAQYLASRGFVVCAQDLLGHGESLAHSGKAGCMAAPQEKNILIEDAHELRKLVASRFSQQTPYIMLGYSFGSLIMRAYSTRYGEDLAAMVLCGSVQEPKLRSWVNSAVSRLLIKTKGEDYKSTRLQKSWGGVFSNQASNISEGDAVPAEGRHVYESANEAVLCDTALSVGVYSNIADLSRELATPTHAAKVPKNLSLLFVSGVSDPAAGPKGSLLRKTVDRLKHAGLETVDIVLYENVGHEVLQGPKREEVYSDIAEWIDRQIVEG